MPSNTLFPNNISQVDLEADRTKTTIARAGTPLASADLYPAVKLPDYEMPLSVMVPGRESYSKYIPDILRIIAERSIGLSPGRPNDSQEIAERPRLDPDRPRGGISPMSFEQIEELLAHPGTRLYLLKQADHVLGFMIGLVNPKAVTEFAKNTVDAYEKFKGEPVNINKLGFFYLVAFERVAFGLQKAQGMDAYGQMMDVFKAESREMGLTKLLARARIYPNANLSTHYHTEHGWELLDAKVGALPAIIPVSGKQISATYQLMELDLKREK